MTGGILQLATAGLDSVYLTEDPNITFFKMVYRRHTNFCMYPYYLNFDKELDFGQNSKCKLSAKGDIVTQIYLEIDLPEILMKLRAVTKKEISDILKGYSIIWNYEGSGEDIITVDTYNSEIVPLINDKINTEVNIKNFMEYQLKYLNELMGNNTCPTQQKIIRLKKIMKNFYYSKCRAYGLAKDTDKQIANGLDLVQYIILNMAKNTNYYNIIDYLINTIIVYQKEEKELIRELYLYNFDDITSLIYNYFIRTLSYINSYPNLSNIYDYGDILIYNIIDEGNYQFTRDMVGTDVSVYFTDVMTDSLTPTEFESNIMSMKAKTHYFAYLDENNSRLFNEYEVSIYKTRILNNMEWNIKKNLSMVRNILQIVRDSFISNLSCFRLGIARVYKYVSASVYDTIDQFNALENIPNYFGEYFLESKLPKEPNGVVHFFGDTVRREYDSMENQIVLKFRTLVDTEYYENIDIWKRTDILGNGILYLENIPILLINDIPTYTLEKIKENDILKDFIDYFDVDTLEQILSSTVKTNIQLNSSVDAYYMDAGSNLGQNKLMLSIFTPNILYDMSTYTDANMVLIKDMESNSRTSTIDYSKLLSIDYIIYRYLLEYFNIIDTLINLDEDDKLTAKQYIFNVLKIFRYMEYYTEFPLYESYKSNGYTLYGQNDFVEDIPISPKYVDAISSIYYELLDVCVNQYNIFINSVLDYTFITNNVGIQIAKMILFATNDANHNYYTDDDDIKKNADPTIKNYIDQYIELFYKDLSNYKSNIDVYNVKNIIFEERIARFFNTKADIADYYYKKLVSVKSSYVGLKKKINSVIQSAENAGLLTEIEYMDNFVEIINDATELSDQDKLLLMAVINKNHDLLYNSFIAYNTLLKYGTFSLFRGMDDVLQYLIYLISTEMNVNNMYDYVYIYKQTDTVTIDETDYLIYQLTEEQRSNLQEEFIYDKYLGISQQIIIDYNLDTSTDEGILEYNTTLENFTDVEYTKYGITQEDIVILKLVVVTTYTEYISIVKDPYKMEQIDETMGTLTELQEAINQNDANSLEKTYKNLCAYYTKEIENSISILSRISVKITNGESVSYIYNGSELEKQLTSLINNKPVYFEWIKDIGHNIIEECTFEIGGQIIETHTSEWFKLFHTINKIENKENGYKKMTGTNTIYSNTYVVGNSLVQNKYTLTIPLNFSFSRHYQAGLPLVALQYTEANIWVKLRNLNKIATWNSNAIFEKKPKLKCRLLTNYIYLEEIERKRICENRLEYLIEMVQRNGETIITKNNINDNSVVIDTFFNNSSKYLVWTVTIEKNVGNDCIDGDNSVNLMEKFDINGALYTKYKKLDIVKNTTVKFDGKVREAKKDGKYYNLVQPYKSNSASIDDNVYMYTFGLDSCTYQPSGSLNTSQINNLNLVIKLDKNIAHAIENGEIIGRVNVYNYSYNILRIMSGMSGLAFYS